MADHEQVFDPMTGSAVCSCGEWTGPMTHLPMSDPRSFAHHIEAVSNDHEHYYVSTACQHEKHSRCRETCKYCSAPCLCPHHLRRTP